MGKIKMKKWNYKALRFLGVAAAASLSYPVYASGIDESTGLTSEQNTLDIVAPAPIKAQGQGGAILWDVHHGTYGNYSPSGGKFDNIIAVLANKGYSLEESAAGILNLDLNNYDVLVVSTYAGAYNTPYSSNEAAAIETFVNNGGGLLVLADNSSGPPAHVNPVTQRFGVTVGGNSVGSSTSVSDHAIFAGVNQIYLASGGALGVASPATEEAWYSSTPIVAVGGVPVVVTADMNMMDDSYIGNADNQLFFENVFDWLAAEQSNDAIVYEEAFVQGIGYPAGTPQYDNWLSFQQALTGVTVQSVTLSGSADPTGVSCTDQGVAQQLANALATGGDSGVLSCDGRPWRAADCYGMIINADAANNFCSCNADYVARPNIASTSANNSNWGGMGTATCNAPSQTLRVEFFTQQQQQNVVQLVKTLIARFESTRVVTARVMCAGECNNVSVDVAASDDTAVDGTDYDSNNCSGTIYFDGPGNEKLTMENCILDDDVDEEREHFFLSIGNAVNAELGEPNVAQVRIKDDD